MNSERDVRVGLFLLISAFHLPFIPQHASGAEDKVQRYFLTDLEVKEYADNQEQPKNLATEPWDPILIKGPTEAEPDKPLSVKTTTLLLRVKLGDLKKVKGENFKVDINQKPDSVTFRVRYRAGNNVQGTSNELQDYYQQTANALKVDPVVFEKSVPLADALKGFIWNGRDTGAAERWIVSGVGGQYDVEVSAMAGGFPLIYAQPGRGTPFFLVERPHATFIGGKYPPKWWRAIFDTDLDPVDTVSATAVSPGLFESAGVLELTGPQTKGYLTKRDTNLGPTDVGQWAASSAVLVWTGHFMGGYGMLTYTGTGMPNDDLVEMAGLSGLLTPVVGEAQASGSFKKIAPRIRKFPDGGDVKNAQLVILACCCSAAPLAGKEAQGKSMVDFVVEAGADVAIGYTSLVNSNEVNIFLKAFFDSQERPDPVTGKLVPAQTSYERAKAAPGAQPDNGDVVLKSGSAVEAGKLSLKDLPRYGRKVD